jgi:hypothetical protein
MPIPQLAFDCPLAHIHHQQGAATGMSSDGLTHELATLDVSVGAVQAVTSLTDEDALRLQEGTSMDPVILATTAVSVLSPYLVKVGEQAAEEVGKKLPEAAGKLWHAITSRLKGKEASEEAVNDLIAKPHDPLSQSSFANQLRKALEADPTFGAELAHLLASAQAAGGDTIVNTGSGAVATHGSVAAGAGGMAVKGDVHGGVNIGGSDKKG